VIKRYLFNYKLNFNSQNFLKVFKDNNLLVWLNWKDISDKKTTEEDFLARQLSSF